MKIFKYMRDFGMWTSKQQHVNKYNFTCMSLKLQPLHLDRCQLQHFPFLPGSKFKPRWLVETPFDIYRLECTEGASIIQVCSYTSAPIECHHVIVLLRESIFYFFFCGWNSTLLQPTKQTALEEMEQRHQFLVMRKNLEGGCQDLM